MSMRHAGWLAVLLVAMLELPARGQQAQPGAAPGTAGQSGPDACMASAGYLGCAPGKLIFLPCMAVGAARMADCRQREVAACLRACVGRHCS